MEAAASRLASMRTGPAAALRGELRAYVRRKRKWRPVHAIMNDKGDSDDQRLTRVEHARTTDQDSGGMGWSHAHVTTA